MALTFRIDDVSANTDLPALRKMIKYLKSNFVCEVWCCISPLAKQAFEGSVYPDPPFKDKNISYFYDVGLYEDFHRHKIKGAKLVSHGLFHVDHSVLQYDAQEMSILSSCQILKTDIFVPPFNRYSPTTEAVCRVNGIQLIKTDVDGWKGLEFQNFDIKHMNWYFHPWRFTNDEFEKKFK